MAKQIAIFRWVRAQLTGRRTNEGYELNTMPNDGLALLHDESGFWVIIRASDFRLRYVVAAFTNGNDAAQFFVQSLIEPAKLRWRRVFHKSLRGWKISNAGQLQAAIHRLKEDVVDGYMTQVSSKLDGDTNISNVDEEQPRLPLHITFLEDETGKHFELVVDELGRGALGEM